MQGHLEDVCDGVDLLCFVELDCSVALQQECGIVSVEGEGSLIGSEPCLKGS